MCGTRSFGDSLCLLPLLSTSETACKVDSSISNWTSCWLCVMLSTLGFRARHTTEKCPSFWHFVQSFHIGRTLIFSCCSRRSISMASSRTEHTLCSCIRGFHGLGNNIASLVPLVCSNLVNSYIGQSIRAKLDCGPPPCLFCLDKFHRFFKSQFLCLGQDLFSYLLVSDSSHQSMENHLVGVGHPLGTCYCRTRDRQLTN